MGSNRRLERCRHIGNGVIETNKHIQMHVRIKDVDVDAIEYDGNGIW